MSLQPISGGVLKTPQTRIRRTYKEINEIEVPKETCSTCTTCIDSTCSFFGRRVEPDYNRCFNHSKYKPVKNSKYVSPPQEQFDKWEREEQEKLIGNETKAA